MLPESDAFTNLNPILTKSQTKKRVQPEALLIWSLSLLGLLGIQNNFSIKSQQPLTWIIIGPDLSYITIIKGYLVHR